MDFTEKLEKLTQEPAAKTRLAKSAGLPLSSVSNYITKRQMPRGDKALLIARALKVPLEWLLDSSQDWPPPNAGSSEPAQFSDSELMREMAKRYRLAALRSFDLLKEAEKRDWSRPVQMLKRTPLAEKMPDDVREELNLIEAIEASFFILRMWEPDFIADQFWQELPGKKVDRSELKLKRLSERWHALAKKTGISEINQILADRMDFRMRADDARESRSRSS